MEHNFQNGKWYIDFKSIQRPYGNLREESLYRAREIANNYSKIFISFSGGLDSQCMLHSFYEQGIQVETVFMYLPGFNDNEYEQVKICDQKYNVKTNIVDLDLTLCKDEIEQQAVALDIPNKNSILHRKFLSLLPDDCTFIQNIGPPSIYINPATSKTFVFSGYYSLEISRLRALSSLNRTGSFLFWDYTPEFLLSTITDDIFKAGLVSYRYIDSFTNNKDSISVDRWDYFIKPFMYGKYWGDQLLYFPKYSGFENIDFIKSNIDYKLRLHSVGIPIDNFVSALTTSSNKFYENHNPNYKLPEIK